MKKQVPQTTITTNDKLGLKTETLRRMESLTPEQLKEVGGARPCTSNMTSSF